MFDCLGSEGTAPGLVVASAPAALANRIAKSIEAPLGDLSG